jgi:hypothetical protein
MADTTEVKRQSARNKQSQAAKRATVDLLKSKKRATTEFTLFLSDDEGQHEVTLMFQSIGAVAYDKLIAKHPPKPEQRVEGASYNMDTFAPALIAACSVEPELTVADANEIWNPDDWSRGDLMVLFMKAVDLNNRGIDIPFSESA